MKKVHEWRYTVAGKNIVLKNVSKVYGNGVYAVRNVNLQIKPREFMVLVGPSGCGKSTTLRMIAGLEEISSGELWIDDVLANFIEPRKREMSMVFQNYALYPNMSVYKNIAFSLEIRGYSKKEINQKVCETAQLLGLEKLLDRKPKALSGGQRQRVAIANAVIRNPDILLMDEPLSNLDAKLRGQMRVELAKLHKALGNTIIYVTHDQTEAMSLGSKIIVMKDGVIQQADTPERIYHNPVNQFVAGFIGSPSMNVLDTDIVRDGQDYALVIGGQKLLCSPMVSCWICGIDGRWPLAAGIRPEAFLDAYRKQQEADYLSDRQKLTVTVTHKEMLGCENILYFDLAGQRCCMKASAENTCGVGEQISVWVDLSRLHLFDRQSGQNLLYERRYA